MNSNEYSKISDAAEDVYNRGKSLRKEAMKLQKPSLRKAALLKVEEEVVLLKQLWHQFFIDPDPNKEWSEYISRHERR